MGNLSLLLALNIFNKQNQESRTSANHNKKQ